MAHKRNRGHILSSHHACEHSLMYVRSGDILQVVDNDGLMAILESENQISEEELCYARINWGFVKFEVGTILLCLEAEQLEESLSLKVLHKEKIYDCIAYINNFQVLAGTPDYEFEIPLSDIDHLDDDDDHGEDSED